MKRLDVPPFLVDCFDGGSITRLITASQIERAGVAPCLHRGRLLVCKDLAKQEDGKVQSLDPAEHRLMFGQGLCINACEGSLAFVLIAQGNRPVGFEGNHEVFVEGLENEG